MEKLHAADYKRAAKKALENKYWWGVLVSIIAAALLGGVNFTYQLSDSDSALMQKLGEFFRSLTQGGSAEDWFRSFTSELPGGQFSLDYGWSVGTGIFAGVATLIGILAIVRFFIGGAVRLGENRFYINIYADRAHAGVGTLFSRFNILFKALWLQILTGLKVFLWTLPGLGVLAAAAVLTALLPQAGYAAQYPGVVTGVLVAVWIIGGLLLLILPTVAEYRYYLAPYLMAENPDVGALRAIRESKRWMVGNKWRLFCLGLSFIGWYLLCGLTFGIGILFLNPYVKAAHAAFYIDKSGRGNAIRVHTPLVQPILPQQQAAYTPAPVVDAPDVPLEPEAPQTPPTESL